MVFRFGPNWALARGNYTSIREGLQDMREELIATGTLKVPDWGCEIPYQVRRIMSAETLLSSDSDAAQFDQRPTVEAGSLSEYALPNCGLEPQRESEQKADLEDSAKPEIARLHEQSGLLEESETLRSCRPNRPESTSTLSISF